MQFEATLEWKRDGQDFLGQRYSRAHTWRFDGGAVVPASSSPLSVALPMSDAAAVDPEEAHDKCYIANSLNFEVAVEAPKA